MRIHYTPVEVLVQAPAKLNLFFEVLGKRSDGFHEIETLMCPISIYDTIAFSSRAEPGIEFECRKPSGFAFTNKGESEAIPIDNKNLAVRAVELLRQHADVRAGARLGLIKRIPVAAGLGGGSSDAAAAMAAANIAWKLNWPTDKLARLAAQVGSDVPFFFADGPAVCRGRGEIIEPTDSLGMLHFVVVRPPLGLRTEDVYKVCRPAEIARSVMPLVDVLRRGDKIEAGRLIHNGLFQAALKLAPWLDRLKSEFAGLDCLAHQMSGSGSSYFGFCRNARHAKNVAERLRKLDLGSVCVVHSCR
jgi:4-diphosphocytidyl-2-C-methyl-D-erythritol kinase